ECGADAAVRDQAVVLNEVTAMKGPGYPIEKKRRVARSLILACGLLLAAQLLFFVVVSYPGRSRMEVEPARPAPVAQPAPAPAPVGPSGVSPTPLPPPAPVPPPA